MEDVNVLKERFLKVQKYGFVGESALPLTTNRCIFRYLRNDEIFILYIYNDCLLGFWAKYPRNSVV